MGTVLQATGSRHSLVPLLRPKARFKGCLRHLSGNKWAKWRSTAGLGVGRGNWGKSQHRSSLPVDLKQNAEI